MTNAIIWTQNRNLDCVKAVNLATRMGLTVEARNIDGNQWTLAQFQAAVPGAKTLPQIVIGDTVLGGFAELVAKSKEQQASAPKVSYANKEERVAAGKAKSSAKREAKNAVMSDRKQAHAQAKMEGTTREQRHAAKAEKTVKTQQRLAAARPAMVVTPQGYIQCAPSDAPHEHHQARYEASKAARTEKISASKAKNADGRAERIAARKSQITLARAARSQSIASI